MYGYSQEEMNILDESPIIKSEDDSTASVTGHDQDSSNTIRVSRNMDPFASLQRLEARTRDRSSRGAKLNENGESPQDEDLNSNLRMMKPRSLGEETATPGALTPFYTWNSMHSEDGGVENTSTAEDPRSDPSTLRSSAVPAYAHGESGNRKRARKILDVGHKIQPGCNECILHRFDCIAAEPYKQCAYCTSTGQAHDCHKGRSQQPHPAPPRRDRATVGPAPPSRENHAPTLTRNLAPPHNILQPSKTSTSHHSASQHDSKPPSRPATQSQNLLIHGSSPNHYSEANFQSLHSSQPIARHHRSPSLEILSVQQPRTGAPPNSITFQFFLSDPTLGAIPKPFGQCNSVTSFFHEALAAWSISAGAGEQNPKMVAVSVSFEGLKRPIVVTWRNAEGFAGMLEAIEKAARSSLPRELDVEVRCIRQG